MGLDMYLDAVRPASLDKAHVRVAYWRKANQIHRWFVTNVQAGKDECQTAEVSRSQLVELRDVCVSLLVHRNAEEACAKLPPQEGFFFGRTDVDSYYWEDLEATVEMLTRAIDHTPEDCRFEYHSSW